MSERDDRLRSKLRRIKILADEGDKNVGEGFKEAAGRRKGCLQAINDEVDEALTELGDE